MGLAAKLAPIVAAIAVFAGGCGDDDDSEPTSAPAKEPAAEKAPSELLGTYTTTLKPSDLPPKAAPELVDGMPDWKLTIANSGGVDNGPVFAIASAKLGTLENSPFNISGDRITLLREECGATSSAYDNEYSFELKGKSLSFSEIKNSCPDEVAQTILTSQPWTKTK